MPEGPEVRTTFDGLARALILPDQDIYLFDIDFEPGKKYEKIPNIDELKKMLPLKFLKIYTRGKKIIFVLGSPNLTKDDLNNSETDLVYIMSSLGMTGLWRLTQGPYSHLWFKYGTREKMNSDNSSNLDSKTTKYIRKIKTLYYDDKRKFGKINIYFDVKELNKKLSECGVDMMEAALSDESKQNEMKGEWIDTLRSGRVANKGIADLMVNSSIGQKYFCGIGNYLRSEVLRRAEINPYRTIGSLSDEELGNVWEAAMIDMKSAYGAGGYSLSDYKNICAKDGDYKTVIYHHKVKDEAGYKVKVDRIGDRVMYWAPDIQK